MSGRQDVDVRPQVDGLRHALERTFDGDSGQFIGTSGAECTLKGAPYGCAYGRGDDDFSYGNSRFSVSTSHSVVSIQPHGAVPTPKYQMLAMFTPNLGAKGGVWHLRISDQGKCPPGLFSRLCLTGVSRTSLSTNCRDLAPRSIGIIGLARTRSPVQI